MNSSSFYLVKVNEQGLLTIELPQMAGRYIVVEQTNGNLLITPLDVMSDAKTGAIAKQGNQWTLLGSECQEIPTA